MKKRQIIKEAFIWAIIAIPFVYYGILYPKLPAQIPIHFDIHGNPDNFTSKSKYWWVIAGTTLGIYALMLIIPFIDPKRKIQQMGNKYYMLKLILVALISLMSIFSIYVASNPNVDISFLVIVLIGLMFLILGNYMPSFKPNYFIGIRTPWTLESEVIWRKTHRMGGWLWSLTGIAVIILALARVNISISIILLLVAAFTPVIYSLILYLNRKNE